MHETIKSISFNIDIEKLGLRDVIKINLANGMVFIEGSTSDNEEITYTRTLNPTEHEQRYKMI